MFFFRNENLSPNIATQNEKQLSQKWGSLIKGVQNSSKLKNLVPK